MKPNLKYITAIALSAGLVFSACKSPQPNERTEQISQNEDLSNATEIDATRVEEPDYDYTPLIYPTMERDPQFYTFRIYTEDMEKLNDAPKPTPKAAAFHKQRVDSPPLFSKDCLDASNPLECSNEAVKAYFSHEIAYPDEAKEKGHEGIEYVTFVVDKNGAIGERFWVHSADPSNSCEGCQQKAVNAVAKMPDWVPAKVDAEPVAVELTIPVYFKYIEDGY